ncbi:ABC transporter ATP-binding protein [Phaeospirillum tilakii]|uniref:ABC transporter ATP-binding protein n=1 Tax=Phaeospirillum tilakii TaxID=741673 RepID=A0ABW5CDY7_9PROT
MLDPILRVFRLLDAPTRRGMAWSGLLMAVSTLLEMLGIGLLIPLFQLLLAPESVGRLPLIGVSFQAALHDQPDLALGLLCLGLMGFFAFKAVLLGLIGWQQGRFALLRQADFAERMLRAYLARPYEALLGRNSAELVRNVTQLSMRLYVRSVLPLLQLATEGLAALGVVGMLLLVDPLVTLGVGAAMVATVVVFHATTRRQLRRWGEAGNEFDRAALVWINQALGSPKMVKLGGLEEFFVRRFAAPTLGRAQVTALSLIAPTWPRLLLEAVAVMAMLTVVLVTVVLQHRPAAEVLPLLGVLGVAAMRLLPSASKIIAAISLLRENSSTIDILHRDGFARGTAPAATGSAPPARFTRSLRLEGVSYTYPGADRPALSGVDLDLAVGDSLALVGRSGAGKTTLADLLLGLLRPSEGRLLLDGIDITADPSGWQRLIGYIPQEIFLLDDSLARNIALGCEDDEIDPARLAEVVRLARLDAVVAALPDGLDTVIGERGSRLSGGQRQRVGIARALYRSPRVLVLDEATSALDAETEHDITQAIAALAGDLTLVVIAHRLSTVRHCARVALMDQGRIVDIGDFDGLAARNADFAHLVALNRIDLSQEG